MELYKMSSFYCNKSLFIYWIGQEICDNVVLYHCAESLSVINVQDVAHHHLVMLR